MGCQRYGNRPVCGRPETTYGIVDFHVLGWPSKQKIHLRRSCYGHRKKVPADYKRYTLRLPKLPSHRRPRSRGKPYLHGLYQCLKIHQKSPQGQSDFCDRFRRQNFCQGNAGISSQSPLQTAFGVKRQQQFYVFSYEKHPESETLP